MTREVYIALIQKDIAELDMLAKGLYESELPSPTIIKLAQSKANDIISNLNGLAEIKKIEKPVEEPVKQEIIEETQVVLEPELAEALIEQVVVEENLPESVVEESIPEPVTQVEIEEEEVFEPIQDLIFEEEGSEMIVEETPIDEDPAPVVEEVVSEPILEPEVVSISEPVSEVKEETPVAEQKEEPKAEEPKPVKENVKILTSRPVYYQEPEIKFERVEPAPKEDPKPVENIELKFDEPVAVEEDVQEEEPVVVPEPQVVEEVPVKEEVKEEPVLVVEETVPEPVVESAPVATPEPAPVSSEIKSKIELFTKSHDNSFISSLASKKIDSVKKAISMVDRFRFQRELFANNADAMNTTIEMLDSLATAAEAEEYLSRHFSWDMDDQNVADFLGIVARRFV